MSAVVDGSDDFRIVRHLHSQRCTSVESLAAGDDARTSVVERSQLQCIFVGFGTAVDEEQRIVLVAAGFAQSFGHLLLQFVDDGVGIESQCGHLLADHLHIMRMRVVEILRIVLVPHVAAFSFDDVDVKEGVYVEKFHV